MSSNNEILPGAKQALAGNTSKPRKPYCKPQLEKLGDLRTLTLGSSPEGFFDSGGGSLYEYISFYSAPRFPGPGGLSQP